MSRLVAALLVLPLLATTAAAEEPLEPFFQALRALESGDRTQHVRVAWWGDSAITSDGYTGEVRRRLQARFGDAGPGFVLASPSFEGYLRDGVRMRSAGWTTNSVLNHSRRDDHYGYGGVVASSWGGASTTLESKGEPFLRVHVLYRAQAKSGGLQIFVGDEHEPDHRLDTAVAEGEEDADRVWTVDLAAPAEEVRLRAAGSGLATVYGLSVERAEPGIVVDVLGVLGLRARRWHHADAAHLKDQVAARSPRLLVLDFGGNERVDPGLSVDRHAEEILETLRRFRAGAKDAACLVMGPTAHGVRGRRLDPRLETIYEGQRRAARQAGCAFYDTVEAMGGEDSVRIYREKHLLGGDMAHLNRRGHAIVGQEMADWLLERYDRWKSGVAASGESVTPGG
ncbi:MAG: GDSL-type esterase/lipase family protein [Myxococcota bacterium]